MSKKGGGSAQKGREVPIIVSSIPGEEGTVNRMLWESSSVWRIHSSWARQIHRGWPHLQKPALGAFVSLCSDPQPHLQTIWCYHRSSSKFTNSRGENTPLHWHTYPSTPSVYHSARTLRRWPFWSRLRILSGMNQFTSVQLALQNDDTEFMNLQSCESCSFFLNLQ